MDYVKAFVFIGVGLTLMSCQDTEIAKNPGGNEIGVEERAQQILEKMTLEEKIGQVIQADIASVTPDEVRDYNLGSVLNGGNSAPGGGKTADPAAWIALADEFWDASTDTSDGGVGIPLIWGTDAVHGHNNLQTATIFPHNSGLGAANDPDLIREIGAVTALEVRATGLDWTFAPTLAVAQDDRWGRAYESYSERPEIIAAYSKAMVEGVQGVQSSESFLKGEKVIATAKHFLGDGGTQYGIDKGDTLGDLEEIVALHGAGYPPAINAGVQSVMASFSSVNGEKMHGAQYLLNDVLRGQMGFTGFVVGDWNGHAEVPGCTATDCLAAFEAGIDMFMAPDSWRGIYDSLLGYAKSGELSQDRLDEAVLRILEVKLRAGLFESIRPSERVTANVELLGQQTHRDVARRAVRQSLVLLKNADDILPLNPSQNILVAGSGADSMQQQTGGWTLSWQGNNNANDEFLNGETIFEGIQAAVEGQGGQVSLSPEGTYQEKPDVAIVVFGEDPYAEYRGDRSDLVYEFSDGSDLALLKKLQADGVAVVSVFLTGRPLWVNPHLNASDAFVIAWLPGTEGGGVADVLIADGEGAGRFDFTGRLSFSWPRDGSGTPIDDANDPKVLFPYGYGLSYGESHEVVTYSEDAGVSATDSFSGAILQRGNAVQPLAVYLGDSSNSNTPAMVLVSESLGGVVKTRGVDYKAQEDAREVSWTGKGEAAISVRAPRPLDLTALGALEDLAIALEWRLDAYNGDPIELAMTCGESCAGEQDLSNLAAGLPIGQWTKTMVPVSCLVEAGLDATQVQSVLQLTSQGQTRITLHAASLQKPDDSSLSCPQ